jgi:hypothetical protein
VGRIITAGGLGSRLAVYPDADTALSAAAAGTYEVPPGSRPSWFSSR